MNSLFQDRGLMTPEPAMSFDAEPSPAPSVLPPDFEARKLALHYAMQMGGADPVPWFNKFHKLLTREVKTK